MKDDFCLNGGYAGDSAWREWFAMCAVERCGAASIASFLDRFPSALANCRTRSASVYATGTSNLCMKAMSSSSYPPVGSTQTVALAFLAKSKRVRYADQNSAELAEWCAK